MCWCWRESSRCPHQGLAFRNESWCACVRVGFARHRVRRGHGNASVLSVCELEFLALGRRAGVSFSRPAFAIPSSPRPP